MDTTMTTPHVGVERRAGQRFAFNLPVSLRDVPSSAAGLGFTQDLSSRGAFFFTDMALAEGAEIELTLCMPSQITLGEDMRVRCRGRVLRIDISDERRGNNARKDFNRDDQNKNEKWPITGIDDPVREKSEPNKIGGDVFLNGYEYLPEGDDRPAEFRRISALHANAPVSTPPSRPDA